MNNHEKYHQLISMNIDNETSIEERAELASHLRDCESCRKYQTSLERVTGALQTWNNETVSADFEQKMQRKIPSLAGKKGERTMKNSLSLIKTSSGVLVAMIVLVVSLQTYLKSNFEGNLKYAQNYVVKTNPAPLAHNSKEALSVQVEPATLTSSFKRLATDSSITPQTVPNKETTKGQTTTPTESMSSGIVDTRQEFWGKAEKVRFANSRPSEIAGSQTQAYNAPIINQEKAQYEAYYQKSSLNRNDALPSISNVPNAQGMEMHAAPAWPQEKDKARYSSDVVSNGYGYPLPNIYYPNTRAGEKYQGNYENQFIGAASNPQTSFSIDVDTASYSNLRRFLNSNQVPPVDSIRIEEMLNYFTYNYPQPAGNDPIAITTKIGPCSWNPQHHLVLIGLQGKIPQSYQIPPSNLVFLIDVSGSMADSNKLPLLKASLKEMVKNLRNDQRVAIVVYAGEARVVLNSTFGSDKWNINRAIDSLQAGGSTNGSSGIDLAYGIAQANFIQGGNNRVILATDGDFNVGATNEWELNNIIEQKRNSGIYLTVLGLGTGNLQDNKMELLADKGNGTYHYLDSIQEGRKVLIKELGSTLYAIAKDVKVQVTFNPNSVQYYKQIGYENRAMSNQDFNNYWKDAGEMGAGHSVSALYEVRLNSNAAQPVIYENGYQTNSEAIRDLFINQMQNYLTVQVNYKDPTTNNPLSISHTLNKGELTNNPGNDFVFASAVAEFGMILKQSPDKGYANFDHVLTNAQQSKGQDPEGQRSEFIKLVEKARYLYGYAPQPVYWPWVSQQNNQMQFKGQNQGL